MDFNNDFDDSFDQFLLDNNNILFSKQTKIVNESISSDIQSRNPLKSPRKSAKIVDDVIVLSSDEEAENHKKTTPEKRNKAEIIEVNSNSSSDVESIHQSAPGVLKNVNTCLQDLTDLTFSDLSYYKESPLVKSSFKETVITNKSVIVREESNDKNIVSLEKNTVSTSQTSILHQNTPFKAATTKALFKTRIIPGSKKKNHRLAGKKPTTKSSKSVVEFIAPKPTALQQKDAVRHIVVHMSNHIQDLLKTQLEEMEEEKRFNFASFQQDDQEILFCPYLYWKPSAKLKEILDKSENIINYNPPYFNQLLLLVKPQFLHRNVHVFVKKELNSETFVDDSFVDLLDIIKKYSSDMNKCTQITVVIYGLEEYLKSQRNKANREFRRQMNQMLSTNDDPKRKKATKTKDSENDELDNLIELTMENIDMFLIDLGMRFLMEFGGIGSANMTPVIVENIQEICELIFRYSRSLSEQLFRNDRRGDAGSDIYMVRNKIAALELEESNGRSEVEKIWLKQLQQMPSMKASVSKAIIEHFPTPYSLWNRLQNSTNPVGLLARIGQDKNAKVGVDLAEKIHLFMTGNCRNDVLKTATSART